MKKTITPGGTFDHKIDKLGLTGKCDSHEDRQLAG